MNSTVLKECQIIISHQVEPYETYGCNEVEHKVCNNLENIWNSKAYCCQMSQVESKGDKLL